MIRMALAPAVRAWSTCTGCTMKSLRRQGTAGGLAAEEAGDGNEIVEGATEEFLVREHREGAGAGGAVFHGLVGGAMPVAMAPAEGERRLISAMTASCPSARRRAAAKDGGGGNEACRAASSARGTGRTSAAISCRFQAMISVSLSDIRDHGTQGSEGTQSRKISVYSAGPAGKLTA
jgi:hypothetical protein